MITAIIGLALVLVVGFALLWTVGLAAALIGGLFMGISVTVIKLFILPRFEAREAYRLQTDNVTLTPQKLEVRYDNYKNGYVVDCYYHSPETDREFVFTTEAFPQDPTPYLNSARLSVVANRIDYSNYYVDSTDLKRLM